MMKYLYIALAIVLGCSWYTDRTHQYYAGRDECIQAQADKAAEQNERDKKRYEAEKEQAVKEALDAQKHIDSLKEGKVKVIEHTKTVVVPKPASCDLSDSELLDYNN